MSCVKVITRIKMYLLQQKWKHYIKKRHAQRASLLRLLRETTQYLLVHENVGSEFYVLQYIRTKYPSLPIDNEFMTLLGSIWIELSRNRKYSGHPM